MTIATRSILILAAAAFAAGSALAQDGAAYISQVERSAAPRERNTAPTAGDQVLLQAGTGAAPLGLLPAGAGAFVPPASATSAAGGALAGNVAILNQIGSGNIGTITQGGGGGNTANVLALGQGNVTSQVQNGSGNVSLLGVSGDSNRSISTTQDGNGNFAAYAVIGDNNSIVSSQTGNNLSYSAAIIGSGKTITVTQTGQGATTTGLPTSPAGAIAAQTRR